MKSKVDKLAEKWHEQLKAKGHPKANDWYSLIKLAEWELKNDK